MSAGPGAYLEPEAAAAQIAAGRQGRGFDSDDEQADGLGDAIVPPPTPPTKKEAGAGASEQPSSTANGDGGSTATPMDVQSPAAKTTGNIDIEGVPNDPEYQLRVAHAAREQEIRRLAQLSAGQDPGAPPYEYDEAGNPIAGYGYGANGEPGSAAAAYGRGRRGSFEASDRAPSSVAADSERDSDEEEEEVDWDDSADEDVDAAKAEALEQARIGMARAAARELRESRATRCGKWWWWWLGGCGVVVLLGLFRGRKLEAWKEYHWR